ncbi:energy-coupling factor ABC transporter permease [Chitinasiproducens palmae]|uniref:Uncharacterized membrane protein n=1 Tax=Chitinasiproducens palmae TaxID=1770053 RepID=A0A1H2PSH1_9BURK|nr:energy-coupling factor ABC transporter permease [Chitinasiproducens palmae]SDV49975.1 Uncharacterized membrane protein [Chitinasiproducens palmae]
MGFLYSPLGLPFSVATWCVALLILAFALYGRPFRFLREASRQHLWLASITVLSTLWCFSAWVQDGPVLHLLGAALLSALFGWRLAMLAASLVVVAVALILGASWQGVGATVLIFAIVPVIVAAGTQRLFTRRLPGRLTYLILVDGVLAASLSVIATQLASFALRAAAADTAIALPPAWGWAVALLLCGEALVSGALTAVLATVKPAWLRSAILGSVESTIDPR